MINISLHYLLFSLFFLLSCTISDSHVENQYYKVLRVIDGDTFVIDDNTTKGTKIRLIGIDAPETRNTGKKFKSSFGEISKQFLSKLIQKEEVRLEYDVQRKDKYKRTLAYVYLKDSTFVNAELLKNGYAQVATFPPNVKHVELFLDLQKEAWENERGLWKKD